MEALRHYQAQAAVNAILASDGPLTAADRQALEESLQWWKDQLVTARDRVQAITARLPEGTRREPDTEGDGP
jgi:hypothetical protein